MGRITVPLRKLTLRKKALAEPPVQVPSEPPPSIGERIATLRTKNGMTQAQLAKAAKMHRPDLSFIETGNRDPRLKTLRQIARGLGVSLSKLVEGLD